MTGKLHTGILTGTALLALAGLCGCVKNEIRVMVDENLPISFNAVVGSNTNETKGLVTGTDFPTDETFGSAAFEVGEALTPYLPESEVVWNRYLSGKWTTAQAYYWPGEGKTLRFFSYSPWDRLNVRTDITAASGIFINRWDVGRNQDVDIMFAEKDAVAPASSAGYSGVATEFRHALSQIAGVTVTLEDGFITSDAYHKSNPATGQILSFRIVEITIDGINTVGDFRSGSEAGAGEEWINCHEPENYVWYSGPMAESMENNKPYTFGDKYILVLPQTFTETACINIKYAARQCVEVSSGGNRYAEYTAENPGVMKGYFVKSPETAVMGMGKKVTYKITIGTNRQIYWAPSIVEWTPESPGIIK